MNSAVNNDKNKICLDFCVLFLRFYPEGIQTCG